MKRLLIDGTALSRGGGIQVAIGILALLSKAEFNYIEIRAIFPESLRRNFPPALRDWPAITWVPKSNRISLLGVRFRLAQIEREFKPDVAYTVFGPSYHVFKCRWIVGFALPKLIYKRSEWTAQHLPLATRMSLGVINWWRLSSFRSADVIVVETETVRDRLTLLLGGRCPSVRVIRNSVNPLYPPAPVGPPKFTACDTVRIFVPSALYEHKNLLCLPSVADELRRLGYYRFVFVLTLDRREAGTLESFRTYSPELLEKNFIFTGNLTLERMAAEYESCACVFLPTLLECSTAVYPESFYFGRPLVTSDRDFARELCGAAARYVDPTSSRSMAQGLYSVLSNSGLRDELVSEGREMLRRVYPSPTLKAALQRDLILHSLKTSFH